MEAFIFPFLLVSKCAEKEKGKKKRSEPREADRKGEESFHSGPRGGEAYFTLWSGASGDARLVFIAFISKDMEKRSFISARGFTSLLPALFL